MIVYVVFITACLLPLEEKCVRFVPETHQEVETLKACYEQLDKLWLHVQLNRLLQPRKQYHITAYCHRTFKPKEGIS